MDKEDLKAIQFGLCIPPGGTQSLIACVWQIQDQTLHQSCYLDWKSGFQNIPRYKLDEMYEEV